jgi:hypothetical protein
VGTAARTDASEAAVSTNAIVPVAAPTAENFKRASDYWGRHGGRDVLMMVDGKIVFERYDNGPKRFFDCCFAVGCAALILVLNSPDIATADAAERPAMVTLLIQGATPVISSKGAEEAWGRLGFDDGDSFRWSGFIGHFQSNGCRFGGIIRSSTEKLTANHIDRLGADLGSEADYYLLASSIHAQQLGVKSRAREIAAAVDLLQSIHPKRKLSRLSFRRRNRRAALDTRRLGQRSLSERFGGTRDHDRNTAPGVERAREYGGADKKGVSNLRSRLILLTDLNENWELPDDVVFTSIVLQGLSGGIADDGTQVRERTAATEPEIDMLPTLICCRR